jgi:hypothetical protein
MEELLYRLNHCVERNDFKTRLELYKSLEQEAHRWVELMERCIEEGEE